ncbi:MAG: winged helix-turn-helix domain-containing protein [Candidatus Omnitrophota bacterium]|jgi:DNA-binding transcriptional ArsR family regulator
MIEKLVTSKIRIKILKLFLSNIDDRYYLRELERILEESLSPLRRQLVKLAEMGILTTEEEANLKYYRLNKNFDGLEDLKKIVLGITESETFPKPALGEVAVPSLPNAGLGKGARFDLMALAFISVFVLATALFVAYSNTKNIKQVAGMISVNKAAQPVSKAAAQHAPKSNISDSEMISRNWKLMPGNVPVLSSGEISKEKKSEEL